MVSALFLRDAGYRDVFRLYRWRNDATTRMMMREREPIQFVPHVRWLKAVLMDPSRRLYVAVVYPSMWRPAVAVGTGRLDLAVDVGGSLCAEMSVTVAPEHRGAGYAPRIIQALYSHACELKCAWCIAHIRPNNFASLNAFKSAGFVDITTASTVVLLDQSDTAWRGLWRRCR